MRCLRVHIWESSPDRQAILSRLSVEPILDDHTYTWVDINTRRACPNDNAPPNINRSGIIGHDEHVAYPPVS